MTTALLSPDTLVSLTRILAVSLRRGAAYLRPPEPRYLGNGPRPGAGVPGGRGRRGAGGARGPKDPQPAPEVQLDAAQRAGRTTHPRTDELTLMLRSSVISVTANAMSFYHR